MVHVDKIHWITVTMKRAVKITWPRVSALHPSAMRKAGYSDDKVKSFWNRFLSFTRDEGKRQSVENTFNIE